jgi:signal transduction histidine kinase
VGYFRLAPAAYLLAKDPHSRRGGFGPPPRTPVHTQDMSLVVVGVSLPGEMTVHADPLRVEQALSNLVDNALRHGGGTVVLSATRHNGTVDLHVVDGGPGFPEDFLAVAFERFSRPELGLGLNVRTALG